MSGTRNGALKAAATNKKKYGDNFYATIGTLGGSNGNTGGFYADRELARRAGKIGGTKSRRGPGRGTLCSKGHSMEDATVSNGKRSCRTCAQERNARLAQRAAKPKLSWDELKDRIFS